MEKEIDVIKLLSCKEAKNVDKYLAQLSNLVTYPTNTKEALRLKTH